MFYVEKEKNLIHIYNEEKKRIRTICMDSGKIYSSNGKREVKTIGTSYFDAKNISVYENNTNNNIARWMIHVLVCTPYLFLQSQENECSNYNDRIAKLLADGILAKIDRILMIAGCLKIVSSRTLIDLYNYSAISKELFNTMLKDKNYLKYLCDSSYRCFCITSYKKYCEIKNMVDFFSENKCNEEEASIIRTLFSAECDKNYIKYVLYHYLRSNKIRGYTSKTAMGVNYFPNDCSCYLRTRTTETFSAQLIVYYKNLKYVERDPANDFYTDFHIVADLAYNKALAETDKNFMKRYDDVLLYENEKFCIVLPKESSDLIEEGDALHHCVGSYISKVCKGSSIIIFVRKKSEPEKPYITAQILPNGDLGQYFLEHDNNITLPEDKEFYSSYKAYIKSHATQVQKLCNYGKEKEISSLF